MTAPVLFSEKINRAAGYLSRMYGLDREDVLAEMQTVILEKAKSDSVFLEQTESYIVQFAVWKIKQQQKKERRIKTVALTDDIADIAKEQLRQTPPALLSHPLVKKILAPPNRYLIAGKVNITKLAEDIGKSWWYANKELKLIKEHYDYSIYAN